MNISIEIHSDDAVTLIELVGGEKDNRGRWVFPDGFTTWAVDEATQYAVNHISVLDDLLAS